MSRVSPSSARTVPNDRLTRSRRTGAPPLAAWPAATPPVPELVFVVIRLPQVLPDGPADGEQLDLAAAGCGGARRLASVTISSRKTQVTNSASSDAAVETGPLVWSKATIHTGNVWYRSRLAMVNSPSTSATVSTVADSRAVRRFGRITRHSVVGHPAPSDWPR